MQLFSKTYTQLSTEAISILKIIKSKITDDSDFTWVPYTNAEDLRREIDKYVVQLEIKSGYDLEEIYSHFLPTSTFQEHSMSNAWSDEYMELAEKFDEIYKQLKKISKR